jgi:hypothetical protein
MKTRDIVRQIVTLVAIVAGIGINVLPGVSGGFGSSDVGAISDQTNTLITPAGITFAIWGVIFTAQIAFAIYQALPSQRENPIFRRMGWFVAFNGIGQGLWTLLFINRQFVLALVLIVALLVALVLASVRIGLGRSAPTGRNYWLAYLPININLGWLAVATIVNAAQVLQYVAGWTGAPLSSQAWAAIMVVVAAALGAIMVLRFDNIPFGLVVVWALSGIALRSADTLTVQIVSVITAVLVAGAVIVEFVRRRNQPGRPSTIRGT